MGERVELKDAVVDAVGKVFEVTLFSKEVDVTIISLGATITKLMAADRKGVKGDVVLGFPNIHHYVENGPYFGSAVGRFCNRIANGKFELNGTEYQLPINNGPNCLHGGISSFAHKNWELVRVFESEEVAGVTFKYLSVDGEEGFPGNCEVVVEYTLSTEGELSINYKANTDKDTVINLTNHTYFDLAASGGELIDNHIMQINASNFTPINEDLIPTGEVRAVEGTPFDFRSEKSIGQDISVEDEQLTIGKGYDHNFVLGAVGELKTAAVVKEPGSGRQMTVKTTEPGVQLYTGNYLDGIPSKDGGAYKDRSGFCLETQHFPDSPNQESFPSTILREWDSFCSTTVYAFSTC